MAQIFPKWTNEIPKIAPPILGIGGILVVLVVWYWFSPKHTDVGYAPVQPVAYSHKLHAGDLGIDCRYCHTNVEKSPHAGVPPTQTCLNCHNIVKKDSPKLALLRAAKMVDSTGGLLKDENGVALVKAEGASIPWKRIHKIPDYAYFDHSAHVTVGVGCKSCHGSVDKMEVVQQVQPLSMSWCLDCHRNIKYFESTGFEPAEVLRPKSVSVSDMSWSPDHPAFEAWREGAKKKALKLNPPTVSCAGCHR